MGVRQIIFEKLYHLYCPSQNFASPSYYSYQQKIAAEQNQWSQLRKILQKWFPSVFASYHLIDHQLDQYFDFWPPRTGQQEIDALIALWIFIFFCEG